MIRRKKSTIGVFWDDIYVYRDNLIHVPTHAYTEGDLVFENKDFVVIKKPETILINNGKIANHPDRRPLYYFIPRKMITKIEYYEKKN